MKSKYQILYISLLLVSLLSFVTGCGGNKNVMSNYSAGLGDQLSAFKQAYGEPSGSALANFQKGKLLVMFVDNQASNITVNFDNISLQQAEEQVAPYLPKDRSEIKRYSVKDGDCQKTIVLYKSQSLSNNPLAKQYSDLNGEPPENLIVIHKADSAGKVFASIIAFGDNP